MRKQWVQSMHSEGSYQGIMVNLYCFIVTLNSFFIFGAGFWKFSPLL